MGDPVALHAAAIVRGAPIDITHHDIAELVQGGVIESEQELMARSHTDLFWSDRIVFPEPEGYRNKAFKNLIPVPCIPGQISNLYTSFCQ